MFSFLFFLEFHHVSSFFVNGFYEVYGCFPLFVFSFSLFEEFFDVPFPCFCFFFVRGCRWRKLFFFGWAFLVLFLWLSLFFFCVCFCDFFSKVFLLLFEYLLWILCCFLFLCLPFLLLVLPAFSRGLPVVLCF